MLQSVQKEEMGNWNRGKSRRSQKCIWRRFGSSDSKNGEKRINLEIGKRDETILPGCFNVKILDTTPDNVRHISMRAKKKMHDLLDKYGISDRHDIWNGMT